MNLVDARIDGSTVRFADWTLALPDSSPLAGLDRKVILGIRPTDFEHSSGAEPDWPRIDVAVELVEELCVCGLPLPGGGAATANAVTTPATKSAARRIFSFMAWRWSWWSRSWSRSSSS
jgi:hypothetical protein